MTSIKNMKMTIPSKWEDILKSDETYNALITNTFIRFKSIVGSELYFFPEYTDHGILHFENTMKIAYKFISNTSYSSKKREGLDAKNISCLVLSLLLHDIGMHIYFDGFKILLFSNLYPQKTPYRDKSWHELWTEYLSEAKHWSDQKKEQLFGNIDVQIRDLPDNKGEATEFDRMFCGEFLRRNHHMLAMDISMIGFPCTDNKAIPFIDENDSIFSCFKEIIGLIGFSHGISLWSAVEHVKTLDIDQIRSFHGIKVPFLMIVLRLSDLFDISDDRIDRTILNINRLNSPVSNKEWLKHSCIDHIDMAIHDDPELIYIYINDPPNSSIYLDLKNLLEYIQNEFDVCWAVLGRVYGRIISNLKLSFRRITSNLEKFPLTDKCNFVAEPISLQINRATLDLFIGPLYGFTPSYGVRELIQNSVDACIEKLSIMKYKPSVKIIITKNIDGSGVFKIIDDGIGMGINVIKNHYLTVGSSYRNSEEWKKSYEKNNVSTIARCGRFGVGVLAGFLLGDIIQVETSATYEDFKYSFCVSRSMSQIEVYKSKNIEKDISGTTIQIKLSKEIMNTLENECSYHKIGYGHTYWSNWYYGKEPEIIIEVPDYWKYRHHSYALSLDNNSTGIPWHSLKTDRFYKIEWFFSYHISGVFFHNGMYLKYQGLRNNFLWPINDPMISVIDKDNRIIFDLNRENVSGFLPFEEDLIIDIYKDLISRVMITSFKVPKCKENEVIIKEYKAVHESIMATENITTQYVFNRYGFFLAHRYTLNFNKVKKIIIINVDKEFNKERIINADDFLNKNIIFIDNEKLKVPKLTGTGFDLHLKYIYLPDKKEKKNIDDFLFCSDWENIGNEINDSFFKKDPEYRLMWKGIKSITVWECLINKEKEKYELTLLEDLLRYYFSENVTIPYHEKLKIQLFKKNYLELNSHIKWFLEYKSLNNYIINTTDYDEIDEFIDLEEKNMTWINDYSMREFFEN